MELLIVIVAIIVLSSAFSGSLKKQKSRQNALAKRLAQERARQDKINAQIAREQERQRRELERQERQQAAEWERQKREDARRDAQLAKHEEQIRKMQFAMEQAETNIERLSETLYDLYALLDYEKMEQAAVLPGSKEFVKHQNKIISLTSRINSTESRIAKAQFTREEARRKIDA